MNKLITLLTIMSLGVSLVKAPLTFEDMTLEQRAETVGLSVDEFVLFSGVVEAESNRDPDDIEGRIYIALTIWNRASEEHPEFGNTITAVLTQPGQFSTVRGGHSVTSRTEMSDRAILEAYNLIQEGDAPEVLFFNCRGFFSWREPYALIGGNYFSL